MNIMKVKDLPENDSLANTRIELPKTILQKFKEYAGGESVMYVVGDVMGYGFMMSPDPPGSKRRLYPFPPGITPERILDWDIAK